MVKKVGIMTLYHKTYNYGAQLQAYALQKAVAKLGYDCELIKFQWSGFRTVMYYENVSRNTGRFREFSRRIPHGARLYTPHDIGQCADEYDIFICGSDQIWGVNLTMPIFVLPQITLSFVPDDKVKIAYAASMGGAALTRRFRDALAPAAARLDAVSVRESSAIPFVSEMTGREVPAVLDPTMLLPAEEWRAGLVPPEGAGKYILVYNIGGNAFLEAAAEKISSRLGCDIRSLSYTAGDMTGPAEFLGLVDGAEYVLTNSFHGTIFSILFHRPFFAFSVDTGHTEFSKNVRILDLLAAFGLSGRFIGDGAADMGALEALAVDFERVEGVLRDRRDLSLNFLKNALATEKGTRPAVTRRECRGCGACAQKCPNQCLSMKEDGLGFLYPHIDAGRCSQCGQCREVCPIGKPGPVLTTAARYFAAHHADEGIRGASSSGGIFTALAENILGRGGIVFGAEWTAGFTEVRHSWAETSDECRKYRLSKYVQSDMGGVFSEAEKFLKSGRYVLFSGCPCHIAALRSFLDRDYPTLYMVDLVCGGITAPGLWRKYTGHYTRDRTITDVSFRNKWHGSCEQFKIPRTQMMIAVDGVEDIILAEDDLFLSPRYNFYRNCCFFCAYKEENYFSDATIGDFCFYSDITRNVEVGKGESLVITRSQKGEKLFREVLPHVDCLEVPRAKTLAKNFIVNGNLARPAQRDYLLSIFEKSGIEKLFYENKQIEQFFKYEAELEALYYDRKRLELAAKLRKFIDLGLSLNDDPSIKGAVIIYGSGTAGQLVCDCFDGGVACFIDRFDEAAGRRGVPVYRPDAPEVRKIVEAAEGVTFIVTPVRDSEAVSDELSRLYPGAHLAAAESLVDCLWL